MPTVEEIDARGFEDRLQRSSLPTVVDFGAPWCAPCRAIAPTLEALAHEWADQVEIVSVNVDEEGALSAHYGVKGLPTLIVFENGVEAGRIRGALPRRGLEMELRRILGTKLRSRQDT